MKFLTLLKKELRELINMQMILGLVITVVMLLVVGNVMSGVMDDAATETGVVNIIDRDKSMLTQEGIIGALEDTGYTVNLVEAENDDPAKLLSEAGCDSLLIIPQGFDESLKNSDEPLQIELISSIKTTSAIASLSDKTSAAVDFIGNVVKNQMMSEKGLDTDDIARIGNPVIVNEITVVQEKSAVINSQMLMSLISSQGMFIPIVVFILVMFTSQMIISAISTEKIDKTLET
ncbi:MAG: ABC transporter permease, partial [Oscillospiraceae bacterium]|nr:ABC transporter permease [Oscillospiraceae bacterium]